MTKENTKDNWDDDVENTDMGEEVGEDHVRYEISSYPSDMSLAEYLRKWKKEDIIIPKFQRNYVWNKNEASKLIESFLLGIPVPGVFLYKRRNDNKFLIVDGQQRILSAVYFMRGIFKDEKVFRLQNVRKRWEGKTFEEFTDADRRQLEDSILRATIVQQLHPDDETSIYHIFERLNTGGKNLNPMEVRRCVYSGEFMSKLEELNKLESWRRLIGKPAEDVRYRDVEWILRILALACKHDKYEKPMKRFLTEFMKDEKSLSGKSLQENINRFAEICNYALRSLGDKPFHLKGRLNYAAMDSVFGAMLTAASLPPEQNFASQYDALKQDQDFIDAVSMNTSDNSSIKPRFSKAEEMLLI